MHFSYSPSALFFLFLFVCALTDSFIACQASASHDHPNTLLSFSNSSSQCAPYATRCLNTTTTTSTNGTDMNVSNSSSMIPCCTPNAVCSASTNYYCIQSTVFPPTGSPTCKTSGDFCNASLSECCGSYYCAVSLAPPRYYTTIYTCQPIPRQCDPEGSTCYGSSSSSSCCGGLSCYGSLFSDEKKCLREDPAKKLNRFVIGVVVGIIAAIVVGVCALIAIIYLIIKWCRNRSSTYPPPQSSAMQNVAPAQLV